MENKNADIVIEVKINSLSSIGFIFSGVVLTMAVKRIFKKIKTLIDNKEQEQSNA